MTPLPRSVSSTSRSGVTSSCCCEAGGRGVEAGEVDPVETVPSCAGARCPSPEVNVSPPCDDPPIFVACPIGAGADASKCVNTMAAPSDSSWSSMTMNLVRMRSERLDLSSDERGFESSVVEMAGVCFVEGRWRGG